jgi:hypothetical protein
LVLLFLASAPLAAADRLMNVPVGRKIPYQTLRFEVAKNLAAGESLRTFTGIGIGRSFDMEIRSEHGRLVGPKIALDFSYNYLDPFIDFNPGVSVGVLDLFDQAQDGRRYFFAMTFLHGEGLEIPLETTLGAVFGRANGAIVGVKIPFGDQFRLMAEHDGFRINAGAELQLGPGVSLRAFSRGRETLLSLSGRVRL